MRLKHLFFTAGLVSTSVFAQTVTVDDTFSDDEISTNRFGTGTGFLSRVVTGGIVSESGGIVYLDSPKDGGSRVLINSNESADTTTARRIAYRFEGVNFALSDDDSGDGETHRTFLGVRSDPRVGNSSIESPGEGFYVEFGFGGMSGNPDGTSTFFYMNSDNVPTALASWTFDNLSLLDSEVNTTELDIEIILDRSDWSINIQGDSANNSPIRFSGTHAATGITNRITTGHAFIGNQSESPNLNLSAKRVSIPEPKTFALLAGILGLSAVLIRRTEPYVRT
ncbi:MAG: hypothetical protein ACSHX8_10175 [Opitutaceae bacterium]